MAAHADMHRVEAPAREAIVSRGLSVCHGGRQILASVDLTVEPGTVTGLLGPSGCGKTTLMRTIVGLQRPHAGSVRVLGMPAGDAALRPRIGYVTQAAAVYEDLTVRENLRYFAGVTRAPRAAVGAVAATVDLVPRLDRRVSTLSGGERARVSLASALLSDPDVLLLDEPTTGLDPVLRESLWATFRSLADGGTALLVSSHVMEEADYCDRLLLMREGRILAAGTPAQLRDRTGEHDMTQVFLRIIASEAPAVREPASRVARSRRWPPLRAELPSWRLTLTARRVLEQMRHDPTTLALVATIPLVLLALMRWIFPGPPSFERIGVPLIGIFPFMAMFMVTSVALLRERIGGTLERLMAMPVARVDVALGYVGAFAVASVAQVAIAMAFGYGVLGLGSAESAAWVALAAVATAVLGTALGLFASVIARTEFQAVLWMALLVLPQVLLCGLLVPRDEMARALEVLAAFLPLTYAYDLLDRLADGRVASGPVVLDVAVMLGGVLAAIVAVVVTLRRSSR